MLLTVGGMLFVWLLLWKTSSVWVLAAAEAAVLAAGLLLRRCAHSHGSRLLIDHAAQHSRFSSWDAGGKFLFSLLLLFGCIGADSAFLGLWILAGMTLLTVVGGKTPLHDYISCILLPLGFVLLSGITIAVQVTPDRIGVFSIPVLGQYLSVTEAGREEAFRLCCKAAGAVSCLCFLSLSTPMGTLIAFFRKIKVPSIVIELMYLIYRYLFILLSLHASMQTAAESRLGYRNFRCGFRTFPKIAANLLVVSFRQASRSFDAMEARCYQGEIRFLNAEQRITAGQLGCYAGMLLLALAGYFAGGML